MTRKYNTGRLNALVEIRNGWRRGQRQKIARQMGPSWIGTEPHWACPDDCGMMCRCDGGARLLAHERCGSGRSTLTDAPTTPAAAPSSSR